MKSFIQLKKQAKDAWKSMREQSSISRLSPQGGNYAGKENARTKSGTNFVGKEKKIKAEFHNQILQTEPVALTELSNVERYTYINFSFLNDDLSRAGVAQSGTAADSDSVALTGLRVRNFGLEPNSEVPSSSAQNLDNSEKLINKAINMKKLGGEKK